MSKISDYNQYVVSVVGDKGYIDNEPFCPFPCGGYCDVVVRDVDECSSCCFAKESYLKEIYNEDY